MKSKPTRREKKPYRPPRLVVYGDLRHLTRAKGGNKTDGGAPKTRLPPPGGAS